MSEVLKESLAGLLEDMLYLSKCTIIKATECRKSVKNLDQTSLDKVIEDVDKLLRALKTNVAEFEKKFHTCVEPFGKVNGSLKRNGLSLTRSGGTPDTDSEAENEDGKNEEGDDNNASDAESEETIIYNNFDIDHSMMEDLPDDDLTLIRTNDSDAGSFTFDDEDYANRHKENKELLEMLNQLNLPVPPLYIKEDVETASKVDKTEELNMALKLLKEEEDLYISDHSLSSSLSDVSDVCPNGFQQSPIDSESEGNISDTETMAGEQGRDDEPSTQLKVVMGRPVDHLNDIEIERLCNVHNLNKRKCIKALRKCKRKRRKRVRVLSSSSSTSSTSGSGSATPDLVIENNDEPPVSESQEDASRLAEILADLLNDENRISSDSSTDIEKQDQPEKKTVKKKTVPDDNQDTVVQAILDQGIPDQETVDLAESDEDMPEAEQVKEVATAGGGPGTSNWRNDPLLTLTWSSSDDSSESDKENKTKRKKRVKTERGSESDKDKSVKPKKTGIRIEGGTTVITDSDSSLSDSDDSVTFVDEVINDSDSKGRKKIREVLDDDVLDELTQRAKDEEDKRIRRLEQHSKNVESVQSQRDEFVLDVDVKTGQPLVTVDQHLACMLKPHQKEGVQFMWEVCYESLDMMKANKGSGCILAHCMGLGKTLQVITLIHTLFTHKATNTKHVLVVCPLSTVVNWKNEFKKAFQIFEEPPNIQLYFFIKGDYAEKVNVVKNWRRSGGVLMIGYEMFQNLTSEKKLLKIGEEDRIEAMTALVDPGPDLIVCDEGHMLKNDKTLRTQALMKVKTLRRIMLTGTPLQNNLKEYYYMVEFVKPHLLGSYGEYMNRFGNPIANGQYHDSTATDIQLMKKRTHVLTKLLKKTIHRVEAQTLLSYLPEITDYTIFIKLTPLQQALYERYINLVTRHAPEVSGTVWFESILNTKMSSLHPHTLNLAKLKKKTPKKVENAAESVVRPDWFRDVLPQDVDTNLDYSAKLRVIMDIINECVRNNDKLLIFVQHLAEMDLIEHFLKVRGTKDCQLWVSNHDYYRMDGDTPVEMRVELCTKFNNNVKAKVFLLTHRIGGLGLNLTGANRVILVGSNHNPSLDTQSMFRVYRFGQTKKCYVYRLLSKGTMEEKLYRRCVVKLAMSGMVVDKYHYDRHYKSHDLREMYRYNFEEFNERPLPAVPSDKLLATLLHNSSDIYTYHLHNALLENRPDEELTDADKKSAWEEFNKLEEAAKRGEVVPFLPPQVFTTVLPSSSKKQPTVVSMNPHMQVPVYQVNSMFNRFGQYCGPRANLVPNPVNSNAQPNLPRNGAVIPNNRLPVSNQNATAPIIRRQPGGSHVMVKPNMTRVQNVETQNAGNNSVPSLQSFKQALANRKNGDETVPEFNYTLNRLV